MSNKYLPGLGITVRGYCACMTFLIMSLLALIGLIVIVGLVLGQLP